MILAGLVFGLGSAMFGGLSNICVGLAGRRVASVTMLAGAQVATFAALVAIALVSYTAIPMDSSSLLTAAAVGFVSTVGYLSFFVALRLGPIAVAGPIVAAYGGIVVLIAVLVFGEAVRPGQVVGVVLAFVGVILAGVVVDAGWRGVRLFGPGIMFAVVASVGFAINVTGLSTLIGVVGWLPALVLWRFWLTTFSCALFVILRARRRWAGRKHVAAESAQERVPRRELGLIVAAGLTDAAAILCLSVGLNLSYVWLVGLISSFGPLSTSLSGLVVFGERLKPAQVLGLCFVGVSLVFLSRS
jgi:drug/metabolite transporter (DMT)-like permease